MIDAKHIAALEAWLNKTRDEQNQLISRLREAENEVEKLRGQISALDEIAQQAESMIDNALVLMRDGVRGPSSRPRTNIAMDEVQPKASVVNKPRVETQPNYPAPIRNTGSSGTVAYLDRSRPT